MGNYWQFLSSWCDRTTTGVHRMEGAGRGADSVAGSSLWIPPTSHRCLFSAASHILDLRLKGRCKGVDTEEPISEGVSAWAGCPRGILCINDTLMLSPISPGSHPLYHNHWLWPQAATVGSGLTYREPQVGEGEASDIEMQKRGYRHSGERTG